MNNQFITLSLSSFYYHFAQLLILSFIYFQAKSIEVQDVSGGCGAMFEIAVEAADFKGMSTINQHRLITNTLKDQIKDMHGIRIQTSVPK